MIPDIHYITALIPILSGLYLTLGVGTVVRFYALRNKAESLRVPRLQSLRTWWLLALVLGIVLLLGSGAVILALMVVSVLGLREYLQLQHAGLQRRWLTVLYVLMVITYLGALGGGETFAVLPFLTVFVFAVVGILSAEIKGYVSRNAGLLWGWLVLVYGTAHCGLFLSNPQTATGPLQGVQWILFLILMTSINDISQALIGRMFSGKRGHRITPVVSPGKTWEGFLGGMAVTVLLAVLLAVLLNRPGILVIPSSHLGLPFPLVAAGLGLVITLAGFIGDLNMSALKRDAGVKDSGTLLPGMGGFIDRMDSLTFTAPASYYLVVFIYG